MSRRLNLRPWPVPWADVNACEHPSMDAAILAFATWRESYLKVIGSRRAIAHCRSAWERLEAEQSIPSAEYVTWFEVPVFKQWREKAVHLFTGRWTNA